ncbi:thioredoxin family protein (plasmid) [Bacillus cereus]|uniref:thioredoxin family protein n=1 Tax=Bacillus cereus TaxID=1396 RepID=UPI0011203EEB|nr:thioredoxin family protein [Bacillus cereus]UDW03913.1 thioredoxin family protein [Bacillus cereus]
MKKWFFVFLILLLSIGSAFYIFNSKTLEKNFYTNIDLKEYEQSVNSNDDVYIYVYKTSCPSCQQLKPHLNEFIKNNKLKLKALNIEEEKNYNETFLDKYKLNKTPTILHYKDGREVERLEGYRPEKLKEFFKKV